MESLMDYNSEEIMFNELLDKFFKEDFEGYGCGCLEDYDEKGDAFNNCPALKEAYEKGMRKIMNIKKLHLYRCDECHRPFIYSDADIVDKSEPENEFFYSYIECPHCGHHTQ